MERTGKIHGEKMLIHCLVNFCLVFIVFVVILMCGFIGEPDSISAFKEYNGVIYKGSEINGKVSLMFNVYWGTEYIEEILFTLEKQDVKATFFVGKTWVDENPDLLKKIHEFGHEIGNHGSNHKEHGKLGLEENLSEIDGCSSAVISALGVNMTLFAPPGGSYNKHTTKASNLRGYKTILWTHDTIDWRDHDRTLIFERATSEVSSGDLILMHPTKETCEALEDIVVAIKGKKLILDTVSNTIKGE